MKLNKLSRTGSPRRGGLLTSRGHLAIGIAVTLLAGLGFFASTLIAAGGSGDLSPSGSGAGGDTVGTLPLMSNPPPPPSPLMAPGGSSSTAPTGPQTPILTLQGPLTELQSMIVDAYGDGGVYVAFLGNGIARMEFYGHDTVLLDRTAYANSFVKAQISIGSSFQNALARISVNGVIRQTHVLHEGTIDTRLRQMSQTGLIDVGVVWHAESVNHLHSVLEFKGTGNLIKIEQRD